MTAGTMRSNKTWVITSVLKINQTKNMYHPPNPVIHKLHSLSLLLEKSALSSLTLTGMVMWLWGGGVAEYVLIGEPVKQLGERILAGF